MRPVVCVLLLSAMVGGMRVQLSTDITIGEVRIKRYLPATNRTDDDTLCNLSDPQPCVVTDDFIAIYLEHGAVVATGDPFSHWMGAGWNGSDTALYVSRDHGQPHYPVRNASKSYLVYQYGYGMMSIKIAKDLRQNCTCQGNQDPKPSCGAIRVMAWDTANKRTDGEIWPIEAGIKRDFLLVSRCCTCCGRQLLQGRISCVDDGAGDPFSTWVGDDSFQTANFSISVTGGPSKYIGYQREPPIY